MRSVTSDQPIIDVREITKQVTTSEGELIILKPMSLQVAAGESLAITGASGSGKSTLLGIMAGLDTPSSGSVWLKGESLSAADEEGRATLRAKYVGFIFQSFQLLSGLSALENVMLPLELRGDQNAKEIATRYLEKVGLAHRLRHYPKQLSGGEQQRVAIARAFACNPRVLFADEPTGNLDAATGQRIIELLFELNRSEGTTLVLVTHEERLASLCQKRIRIDSGEIMGAE